MKKLTVALIFLAVLVLCGCSDTSDRYDGNGSYFNVRDLWDGINEKPEAQDPESKFAGLRSPENKCGDNAYWKLENGTLTVYGSGAIYDYPVTLADVPVTTWQSDCPWFASRAKIKEVVICEGITRIGVENFHGCIRLERISLPDTLLSIGDEAFYGCMDLCADIVIPDSVKETGKAAFRMSGVRSIVFGTGNEKIGDRVCYECGGLEKVVFKQGVRTVGEYAFYKCEKLTDAVFPEGLEEIGHASFERCSLNKIILPDSLTKIGEAAFCGNSEAKTIKLSKGLTVIPFLSFENCGYEKLEIPEGVERINKRAFRQNYNLKTIRIPTTVTYIDYTAFELCENVTDILYNGTKEMWNNRIGRNLNYEIRKHGYLIKPHYNSIIWNENIISGSAVDFNADLAYTCAKLCQNAYSPEVLRETLSCEDFKSFRSFNYSDGDSLGRYSGTNAFSVSHRFMLVNGKQTSVVCVVLRGTMSVEEAVGDFIHGRTDEFGVEVAKNVYDFYCEAVEGLRKYVDSYRAIFNSEELKFVVTGHSLGGAAANLLSAWITSAKNERWSGVIDKSDVFTYTFGAIVTLSQSENISAGYENIHNVYNYYDSFGPNGNLGYLGASTPYNKFGHTDMYRDERFHDSESVFSFNNHDLENYLNALSAERENGGVVIRGCAGRR